MNVPKPKAQLMRKRDILINNEIFSTQLTNFSNNQYHIHDFYEIFYVLEGKGRQLLNHETTTLSTGDLFILRADKDCHSFSSESGDIFIHRDIMIERNLVKETADFLSPDLFDELENATTPFSLNLSTDELKDLEAKFLLLNKQPDKKTNLILPKKILVDILALTILNTNSEKEQLPI
ncbi:MAG: AraC family ligand binding domain-containing protein, partial [Clostridia bacterium]|nr:AraC family ligand binding domain-containing protein [Clostridia bacterium]